MRAVEHGGRDAHIGELRHLVLHQGDQRADHQHGAAQNQRRKLVAERLAAAGGHDHGGVVALHQALNDALLHGPERIVAPILLQGLLEVGHVGNYECINRTTAGGAARSNSATVVRVTG